ncbi:dfda39f6-a5c8-46ae-bf19-02b514ffa04e [Thermothielavioides terrestris]|uniref:Dfda39f6-a5c8-46ae-bf19-02b514ffa04e n=1 Tax=Thermothielavioides terrestris TaxID=2587410 RepID=A0A3S4D3Y7_9PEZI|nr:dfda39f6-a5c8-46ae-bf19-02b514ffa04e [Thermothielavioides terrestris]
MVPLSLLIARSDYNDAAPSSTDDGSGDATLGVSGLVIALAVISVALRFYTRIFTRLGLGWDDWLIFAAVIFTLATAVLLLWGNSVDPNGTWVSENTNPNYDYTPQDIFYLKLAFACSILYFLIAGTTKLGILFMYNRIFYVSRAFRFQLWVASFLVVSWWFACNLTAFLNCRPLEWSWLNSLADPRYCINYNIFWMAAGACEIFLDVLILTLPISVMMRMGLTLRQKFTVGGIFLLGGFVIITGLVKVILGYPPGSRVPSYSNTEVWTEVHTAMSMVCACLPIFGPLARKIKRSAFGRWVSAHCGRRKPGPPRQPEKGPQGPSWSKIKLPSWHSSRFAKSRDEREDPEPGIVAVMERPI